MQDAFLTALERWPRDGLPDNPAAWIVTAARNRALDRIRSEKPLGGAARSRSRPSCGRSAATRTTTRRPSP